MSPSFQNPVAQLRLRCCYRALKHYFPTAYACIFSATFIATPAQNLAATTTDGANLTPSWETQRRAAAYSLAVPAPRGQITDRNGVPLAQTRISYNLSLVFPTPLDFTDQQIID